MTEALALAVVIGVGLYLLVFGAASIWVPEYSRRFLGHFAQSPTKHYAELLARLLAGSGFVFYSVHMLYSGVFYYFGWVLIITTVCLLFVPWRFHQRFAHQAVARVSGFIPLIGLLSCILGGFIFMGLIGGS